MRTLSRQHKQLMILFGNIVMKTRTETELIADCQRGTEMILVTAVGFYSMFGFIVTNESGKKHEMVTAISVEA